MKYTIWQTHVLKTLWNVRDFGQDDARGMGALIGRSAKVAADKLRRLGLVERIERGTFAEPGYRLTADGLTVAQELFEPVQDKRIDKIQEDAERRMELAPDLWGK